MMASVEVMVLACMVSAAAAIPGVFLILRKVAMMSDAISHSILLGIVLMFFVVRDIHSPLLLVAAALTGLLTVFLIELFIKSGKMKQDAAIGLVFPFFFALGILLINRFAATIHLDQDTVLLGEIAFAPFNRWIWQGIDLGPVAIWTMGLVLVMNSAFVSMFYKELKISTFDASLATSMGISPFLLHYGLMTCVSVTTVTAFDAVGAILIVALMIVPPATAYLLTRRLSTMIFLSMGIGCLGALMGYGIASLFDGSISGAMAASVGLLFVLALIFSKEHGLLLKFYTHQKQKIEFSALLLLVQIYHHENTQNEQFETSFKNLIEHMGWSHRLATKVIEYTLNKGLLSSHHDTYQLSNLGREQAKQAIVCTVL